MNYQIARNGQQVGSYTESQIIAMVASGQLAPTDLAWTEGMAEWQAIQAIPALNTRPAAAGGTVNPYAAPMVDVTRASMAGGAAELATLGQRLGAAFIDGLTFLPCGALFFAAMPKGEETETISSGGQAMLALAGLLFLGIIIYNIYLLSTRGQTIGKRSMNIRIARFDDNSNPGFVKAFLIRGFVNGLIGIIPFYGWVDIFFIFRQDRRCIHDLLAGTHVLKV